MLEIDPETQRRNNVLGWALFGLTLSIFAGTIGIAFAYLAIVE